MYKTIKDFKKLQFPLYVIPSDNWDITDGIVFIEGQIVDDLNRSGKSIGLRRLQSGRPGLLKLKNPLFLVSDVILSKKNHFISSCGQPFTYNKTGFQKLKYHRVKGFDSRETFSFVWLSDVSIPFEIPRPPSDLNKVVWARVLYYKEHPWMIYDYHLYEGKPSRIKV